MGYEVYIGASLTVMMSTTLLRSSKEHQCLGEGVLGSGHGHLLHSAVMLITPCQAPRGMESCVGGGWGVEVDASCTLQ